MISVLGLDPGLSATGWGVISVDKGKIRHLAHGYISTLAKTPTGDRLSAIFKQVTEVIELYKPVFAGVEALFFAKNQKSAIPVAQARGVLLLACNLAGVTSYEYPPPEIKMALTGSGRADKKQVQELVRLVLGMQTIPEPDHAADALAAAITAYHTEGASIFKA